MLTCLVQKNDRQDIKLHKRYSFLGVGFSYLIMSIMEFYGMDQVKRRENSKQGAKNRNYISGTSGPGPN